MIKVAEFITTKYQQKCHISNINVMNENKTQPAYFQHTPSLYKTWRKRSLVCVTTWKKYKYFYVEFGHIILIRVARSYSNNSTNSTGTMVSLIHNLETLQMTGWHSTLGTRYKIQLSLPSTMVIFPSRTYLDSNSKQITELPSVSFLVHCSLSFYNLNSYNFAVQGSVNNLRIS